MTEVKRGIDVLVIGNNHRDYVLIEEYLQEEMDHPDVERVATLAEARKVLEGHKKFDVILLDLTLPDANSEAMVRRVVDLSGQIPVIVLTEDESKQFGLKTLSMGISDYLLKDELNPFLLAKSISYSIERNRINQSLKQSEQQYRNLFDLSPLPKWVYNVETLQFLDVNQTAIDHYGYSREEFLSMNIKDIRPAEDIPELEQTLEKSLEAEGIYASGIYRHQKKNGELIEVDIRSTVINYNGEKAKLVVAHDITDRLETEKQLALSEQRFKSLVQEGSDLIAILDEDANYKYVAPTAESVLGIPVEDFRGTNALDYIHEDDQQRIKSKLANLVNKDCIKIEPFRFQDAEGNWRWVETIATNLLDNPAVEGFVANSRDVTERIEREQKLQESLELYEYVTKATDDVVYDWNIEEDVLTWDDSFHSKFIFDIEKGKYTIDYWAQNVHPEDLPAAKSSLNDTLNTRGKSKWEQEYRFKKRDGSYATVFERGFIIRDEDGDAIRMIGSLQDITERKEYEEKLEELSLVASKTTDVIIMTDANDRITWVNEAYEELTGYSFDESIGENPGELLQGPGTDPDTVERLGKAVREQKSIQQVILNYSKTGEPYWLDITIDPIFDENDNCEGFIAIEKDVTEQIEQQRELRESVERYDIVSKATSDTIWDLDLNSDTIEYNQNIYSMFGYEKEEVEEVGEWWRNKIHPDDRDQVIEELEEAISEGRERLQLEYRFKVADGSYKHIFDRAFIVTDEEGNALRIIGAMQDITRQKEERKWLQLFESAIANTKESVAIIEAEPTDLPGRKILYVNEAFTTMTGYSEYEVIDETLHILNGPKTSSKKRNKLRKAMEQWEPCQAELINYRKSGEEFWIHVSMAPVKERNGTYSHWVCVGREVTDRKQREKELKESLKEKETLLLEIHHRVKNNLAVVSGMMQLQAFQEDDERISEKLFDSVARIQTMGSIHELLYQSESFSRLKLDENIRQLVSNITETFQSSKEVDISFNLDPIDLNINQAIPCSLIINEVVTNVLKHAFKEQDTGKISVDLIEENQEVNVKIQDNGAGLPDNFEASINSNTLGLKLIETLATQLNGEYAYKSTDSGASFALTFEKAEVKGIGNIHLQ